MGIRQVGVLHGLTKLVAADAAGMTDGQLLRRFASTRDDGAFAALIQRHGPLVYGVCRNVLRHEQDAEDAFQATFLVLAQRAGAVREGLALGGWLYRVAFRVATKARLAAERRRRREARQPRSEEDRPVGDLGWRELQAMLDEELNRLPEKYRAPFVLCVLSGKSKPEAAAELGWKEGTVSSRLATAREKLRVRLLRRGVTLSAILSGLAIAAHGTASALPVALAETTRKAAVAYALGQAVAAGPAALARAVLRGMSLARLRNLAITLALVSLTGTAVVVAARSGPPLADDSPPAPPVAAAPPPLAPPSEPAAAPAAKDMTLAGKVIGPDGQPMPDARVTVAAIQNRPVGHGSSPVAALADSHSDRQGAFELTVPQTTQARHRRLTAIAKAPGYGFSTFGLPTKLISERWVGLPDFKLSPARPARARILDPEGQPAREVTVHVLGLRHLDGSSRVDLLYSDPPVPLPDWPGPFVTDDEGTFTVPDLLPKTTVFCQTRDKRYGPQWTGFVVPADDRARPPVMKLSPPRVLTGRVLAADTHQPLADTTVVVVSRPAAGGPFPGFVEARTDADGRYAVQVFRGGAGRVTAYPPAGTPYPVLSREIKWPAASSGHEVDLTVPRGVLVRGRVVEAGSDRPVAGATVDYKWADRFRDPAARPPGDVSVRGTVSGPDGTFVLAVPAGSGHVIAKAAEPDYIPAEIPAGRLRGYGKGGRPEFPDGFAALRVTPEAKPAEVTVRVRRGVTVRGRVLWADGKPARVATLYALHYRPRGTEAGAHGLPVQFGRFELPGCEPGVRVAVWVYDHQKQQAAFAEFTADPAAEPVVRLAPTVTARARLVDPAGAPVPQGGFPLAVVFRPGAAEEDSIESGDRSMITVSVGQVHEAEGRFAADARGDVVLPGLIPGATYTFEARGTAGQSERQTFTAPATGTLDLGRITLKPPTRRPLGPGRRYFYQPLVRDPDGDPMTFTLVVGPPGMTMDPETGALLWVPRPDQVGLHKVEIRVTDPYGGSATQAWQIRVSP